MGNFTIVDHHVCFNAERWAALRASGLKLVLNLGHFSEDLLRHPHDAPEWPQIVEIQRQCERDGMAPIAVLISDEPYLHLYHGTLRDWPSLRGVPRITPSIVDAYCDGLSRYSRAIKGLFAGSLVGAVDTVWQSEHKPGWRYQPVPRDFDYVAIDAYLTGEWRDAYAAQFIPAIYGEAWKSGHKPILAVPQAFKLQRYRGQDFPDWAHMPTVGQMQQQVRLIGECQGVLGVGWFALDFAGPWGDTISAGLAQMPDRLAAAQDYWRHCQDVLRPAA